MAEENKQQACSRKRLPLLDVIRGLTLISMIAYHGAWDLVYLAGLDWPWYHSQGAFYWQQSICWSFILLSGVCVTLSHHLWKRGLEVYACGILVTVVTLIFLPEDRVIFGVLTFLGSAMLITALLYSTVLVKIPWGCGLIVCAILFAVFRSINSGYIQIIGKIELPKILYQGSAATYIGFTDPAFYSTDYFSLLPWIFLFWCGMYLGILLQKKGVWQHSLMQVDVPLLSFMGRHSLFIYLLHQPVLYGVILLCQAAGLG